MQARAASSPLPGFFWLSFMITDLIRYPNPVLSIHCCSIHCMLMRLFTC
jgi:hypothetical protein